MNTSSGPVLAALIASSMLDYAIVAHLALFTCDSIDGKGNR